MWSWDPEVKEVRWKVNTIKDWVMLYFKIKAFFLYFTLGRILQFWIMVTPVETADVDEITVQKSIRAVCFEWSSVTINLISFWKQNCFDCVIHRHGEKFIIIECTQWKVRQSFTLSSSSSSSLLKSNYYLTIPCVYSIDILCIHKPIYLFFSPWQHDSVYFLYCMNVSLPF